jgi:hypothetical protein
MNLKFVQQRSKSHLLRRYIHRFQVADTGLQFALSEFSVGRCQRMLFPLAAGFLYPIVIPADFMPMETRKIWNPDQKLSEAWALTHVRLSGVTTGGGQAQTGMIHKSVFAQ